MKHGKSSEGRDGAHLPRLHKVTLDASLLLGAQQQRAPTPGRRVQGQRRPRAASSPSTSPGRIFLDTGEAEDTYLHTLRTHFIRTGTAEPNLPMSRGGRTRWAGAGPLEDVAESEGSLAPLGSSAAGQRSPGRVPLPPALADSVLGQQGLALWDQEGALWEEREQELLDAQGARLAQLEDALRSREVKREQYVDHRLEAAAADKVAALARQRSALAKQRALLARHAAHARLDPRSKGPPAAATAVSLPALAKPRGFGGLLPALSGGSPTVAAVVQAAKCDLASYTRISNIESGLLSRQAFTADHLRVAQPQAGGQRQSWAERKQATYGRQLDTVYSQMQASKAATGRFEHPLEPLHAKPPPPGGKGTAHGMAGILGATAVGAFSPEETTGEGAVVDPLRTLLPASLGQQDGCLRSVGGESAGSGQPGSGMQLAASEGREEGAQSGAEEGEPIEESLLAHRIATRSETTSHEPLTAQATSSAASDEAIDEAEAIEQALVVHKKATLSEAAGLQGAAAFDCAATAGAQGPGEKRESSSGDGLATEGSGGTTAASEEGQPAEEASDVIGPGKDSRSGSAAMHVEQAMCAGAGCVGVAAEHVAGELMQARESGDGLPTCSSVQGELPCCQEGTGAQGNSRPITAGSAPTTDEAGSGSGAAALEEAESASGHQRCAEAGTCVAQEAPQPAPVTDEYVAALAPAPLVADYVAPSAPSLERGASEGQPGTVLTRAGGEACSARPPLGAAELTLSDDAQELSSDELVAYLEALAYKQLEGWLQGSTTDPEKPS